MVKTTENGTKVRKVRKVPIIEEKKQVIAFWRPTDPYGYMGQWWKSDFYLTDEIINIFPDNVRHLNLFNDKYNAIEALRAYHKFTTAEQFMMMGKAALFGDREIFNAMSKTNCPKQQKKLGRKVSNFDAHVWDKYSVDIVKLGNYLKFSQNDELRKKLLETGNAILVEASPLDKIWGIGLRFDNPKVNNPVNWKGTNLLGISLEFVRASI
jgi:ribA/ribD-fused uncharacterized protein